MKKSIIFKITMIMILTLCAGSQADPVLNVALAAAKPGTNQNYISQETYNELINELMNVGAQHNRLGGKVNVDGELRYHYAANRRWRDSSGFRLYLGFDSAINKNWHAYGILEGNVSLLNYNNNFKLSRLYLQGKLGTATMKAGSFGYLMGEGNIYDSGFKGVSFDFGDPVQYTFSYGETNDTKETSVATARYKEFDYNLETSVYRYEMIDGNKNTIWTVGGNYNFSNFGIGAMYLASSLRDSKGDKNGYVFSVNYGELKAYRPGTYSLFAKYYNQPQYTYIAHGMNGLGGRMRGFRGYGLGMHYALAPEVVAGIEYYNLTDKISGAKGETCWSQLTYYF